MPALAGDYAGRMIFRSAKFDHKTTQPSWIKLAILCVDTEILARVHITAAVICI